MKVYGLLVFSLALLNSAIAFKSYDGYQVLRTESLDETSAKKLAPLIDRPELDFWTEPRVGRSADIMVGPQHVELLRNTLARLGLKPTVLVPDVGATVVKERAEIEALKRSEKPLSRAPILDRYMDYDEIQAYLYEVVAAFPSIATLLNVGTSTEGRPLRVLKLSNGPGKAAIFFDAAIHAREWAGPPVVMHAINELTENLAANQAMLDKNDFYFLPVANPDGYAYTWAVDRFWRKTRSLNAGTICLGTDPNRNFDYNWGGGGIPIECDLMYPGSAPFSEPESSAIAEFLIGTPAVTFYVAVHSYGQYILYPYGDKVELPPNFDELDRVSREAAEAVRAVQGTRYRVSTTAAILYFAYGQCDDWVYEVAGVPFSYTIELPGGGTGGFDLPPADILPMAAETWQAIRVFAANIPAGRR